MNTQYWTVVRHSAWELRRNPQFQCGLELALLTSEREVRKVEEAGGLLFTDYQKADDYVMKACYPDGYRGIIPLAPGRFSPIKIGELAVYVPVPAGVST